MMEDTQQPARYLHPRTLTLCADQLLEKKKRKGITGNKRGTGKN